MAHSLLSCWARYAFLLDVARECEVDGGGLGSKEDGAYPYCCCGRRRERAVRSRNSDYLVEQM